MALVSMAINLMQEQLVAKAKWVSAQMGKKEQKPGRKYVVSLKKITKSNLITGAAAPYRLRDCTPTGHK